jgi:hypothetical protein
MNIYEENLSAARDSYIRAVDELDALAAELHALAWYESTDTDEMWALVAVANFLEQQLHEIEAAGAVFGAGLTPTQKLELEQFGTIDGRDCTPWEDLD